jgi:hypothetical protein
VIGGYKLFAFGVMVACKQLFNLHPRALEEVLELDDWGVESGEVRADEHEVGRRRPRPRSEGGRQRVPKAATASYLGMIVLSSVWSR